MNKQERLDKSIWETYRSMGAVLAEGLMGSKESKEKNTVRGVKARVQRKVTKVLGQSRKQIAQGVAKGHADAAEDASKEPWVIF